jgi:hypothetical protein
MTSKNGKGHKFTIGANNDRIYNIHGFQMLHVPRIVDRDYPHAASIKSGEHGIVEKIRGYHLRTDIYIYIYIYKIV